MVRVKKTTGSSPLKRKATAPTEDQPRKGRRNAADLNISAELEEPAVIEKKEAPAGRGGARKIKAAPATAPEEEKTAGEGEKEPEKKTMGRPKKAVAATPDDLKEKPAAAGKKEEGEKKAKGRPKKPVDVAAPVEEALEEEPAQGGKEGEKKAKGRPKKNTALATNAVATAPEVVEGSGARGKKKAGGDKEEDVAPVADEIIEEAAAKEDKPATKTEAATKPRRGRIAKPAVVVEPTAAPVAKGRKAPAAKEPEEGENADSAAKKKRGRPQKTAATA